ncbi:MAG: sulfur transferase domain-containing protein [Acetobacteraceae bacterium]|nr:sulfur transferase domain-containing protein [Acetobacteraceae bacterium]
MTLASSGFALDTVSGRFRAWADALFVDHGVLRLLWRNRAVVEEGRLVRSNQPLPFQLAAEARRGIRTVINLRGVRDCGSDALEREACAKLGLALVDAPFESRGAPHKDRLLRLAALFESIAYPALIHCKSGADRAGLVAAVYLLLRGRPIAEAKAQLSLRFGHIRAGPTGILDAFLDAYEQAQRETGIGFLDWVRGPYDEAALRRSFRASRAGSVLTDRLLRRE